MLEFREAVLGYAGPKTWTRVTQPLTLSVAASGVTAVVGASGVGKTTLLRAVAGLSPPLTGRLDRSASGDQIWFMPQTPILIPFRTGLENALFGIETIRPVQPADIEAAWELLRRLRLPPELGVPGALSGGMRRRAALAQAILSDRKLMVLDEALAGLDYDNRLAVEDELWRATSHGRGCLLASHDVDSVVALADRVIVLKPPQPAKAVMLDIASGFAPESQAPSKRRRTKDFPKLVVRLQRELWETAA